ncbi:acyl carrier protein [Streptomyces albus]|uniref:acyl carrier protein n=1 Tax=Streptomyces albus TaxID=1888 RepID=UPI0004CB12FF|nr:acyl carrier protein [Streptomyces albus]
MNRTEALAAVKEAILSVAPNADVDGLPGDAPFREVLELDSLDFLGVVTKLAERTGYHIDDADYPALDTLEGAADFVAERAP